MREAIVFVEKPADLRRIGDVGGAQNAADIFAEMEPYVVHVAEVDDSRDPLYTRQEMNDPA